MSLKLTEESTACLSSSKVLLVMRQGEDKVSVREEAKTQHGDIY